MWAAIRDPLARAATSLGGQSQMSTDHWTAARIRSALTPGAAIAALAHRLKNDPPSTDRPTRTHIPVTTGELLLMPDESADFVGVKIVSVSALNGARGIPAIQGLYVLMDADTLTPIATFNAAELTLMRTSAVSLLAVTHLDPAPSPHVVIVGSGPQALAHADAAQVLQPQRISIVARTPTGEARIMAAARARDIALEIGTSDDLDIADVILCCSSSSTPVVRSEQVRNHTVVVAMGTHDPTARELDTALMARAYVVVESRVVAQREAGDIVIAEAELGHSVIDLDLEELVNGAGGSRLTQPAVFKSVGEAWEDLSIVRALVSGSS